MDSACYFFFDDFVPRRSVIDKYHLVILIEQPGNPFDVVRGKAKGSWNFIYPFRAISKQEFDVQSKFIINKQYYDFDSNSLSFFSIFFVFSFSLPYTSENISKAFK